MKAWLAIALQPAVRLRAVRVAIIVGPVLVAINQGDVLFSGAATTKTWIQIGLTFLVPYCVSTFSSIQAILHTDES